MSAPTDIELLEGCVGQRDLFRVGEVASVESGAVQIQRLQRAELAQSDGTLQSARHGQIERLNHGRLGSVPPVKHEGTRQVVVAQVVLQHTERTDGQTSADRDRRVGERERDQRDEKDEERDEESMQSNQSVCVCLVCA